MLKSFLTPEHHGQPKRLFVVLGKAAAAIKILWYI
jgi:hypothetical protein